jgi:hypothetical protein
MTGTDTKIGRGGEGKGSRDDDKTTHLHKGTTMSFWIGRNSRHEVGTVNH